jgi:hypothetical protein
MFETCAVPIAAESRYGDCDQMECGGRSSVPCASEDCSNSPCQRHAKRCPCCQKHFCESSDESLWTCFFVHVREGRCQDEILRVPLGRLTRAFVSGQYPGLEKFVNRDSDGLGHPLPKETYINHALAVAYSRDVIPQYNRDVLIDQGVRIRNRRAQRQRARRAGQRLKAGVATYPSTSTRLAPYRNSTIHVVTGALAVRQWTGSWHYREQMELLKIMGLYKGDDFIRDRIRYLRMSNPTMFHDIELWAAAMKKR